MIVLDTNVVSEPLKPEPSEHVMAWASRHADDLAITSVTVGELLTGIAFLPEGVHKQAPM
ncbi:MAG: hypothetical protein FWE94_06585 [Coriobacteriia bacterium]|nr:hypothetical protein [Coriobacteriia bacterium]